MGLSEDHLGIVDISPDTVSNEKHRERFRKFTARDWARIQTMLTDGEWTRQPGDQHQRDRWEIEMVDEEGKP